MNEPSPVLKRRNFFGLLGTGVSYGSMLVASPLVAGEISSAARPVAEALRIGVVMPRSQLRPDLGKTFCAGLELACEQHPVAGRTIVPLLEEVGVGGNGWHSAFSRLLGDHQPRLIVGMLDARLAVEAGRLCEGKAAFLDCSAGAIIPDRASYGRPRLHPGALAERPIAWAGGRHNRASGRRSSRRSTMQDTMASMPSSSASPMVAAWFSMRWSSMCLSVSSPWRRHSRPSKRNLRTWSMPPSMITSPVSS